MVLVELLVEQVVVVLVQTYLIQYFHQLHLQEVEVEVLVGQLVGQTVKPLENLEVLVVEQLLLIMVDLVVHQLLEDQVIHLLLLLPKETMEVQHLFIHHIELVDLEVVLELSEQIIVVDQGVME